MIGLRFAAPALVLAFGAMGAPRNALATTIDVTGGNGLDSGEICAISPAGSCVLLSTAGAVSGSLTYTPVTASTGTVSISLDLLNPASFGATTVGAGSTFTASGIAVTLATIGTGKNAYTNYAQSPGAVTGSANLILPSGITESMNAPLVNSLNCDIGGGTNVCGFSFGAAGLELTQAGTVYDALLTFNTNVTAVPLPGTAWLLLSGLGGFVVLGRKRKN